MENFDFEKNIKRLEKIAETLEKGELSLEKTVKLYEEGTAVAAQCAKALDEAEFKINDISAKKGEKDD